jgi:hypothetical protein
LKIAVATTSSRCLEKKALTQNGCNLPFTANLAVTTTLLCTLENNLRGITMSIKTQVLSAVGSLSVLCGLLTPIGIAQAGERFVSVPSNYVYDTSGRSGKVTLHDYCTKSPDEFPNPFGKNADFRGPCARHDMCYSGSTDEKVCDARLWRDMISNCKYTYGFFNPTRRACYRTAAIYFAVVVAVP